MGLLNKNIYEVKTDHLIYDTKHPVDAKNVQVSITPTDAGVIARGQVIDVADGVYTLHAKSGTPSCIAAEDVGYESDDSEVIVPCYITGAFRAERVIASPELTESDVETLRSKGIILK